MKRTLVPLALLLPLAAGCVVDVQGSGIPREEARFTADFRRIEARDTLHAQVIAGVAPSVIVHGDDNIVPIIRTDVIDGRLIIDADLSYASSLDVGVLVTVPDVDAVTARDLARVEVDGVNTASLAVEAEDLADVRVAGLCGDVAVWASDLATVDAIALFAATAHVEASDSATAEVHARQLVTGSVSDSATAHVYGRPWVVDVVVTDAAVLVLE